MTKIVLLKIWFKNFSLKVSSDGERKMQCTDD